MKNDIEISQICAEYLADMIEFPYRNGKLIAIQYFEVIFYTKVTEKVVTFILYTTIIKLNNISMQINHA